MIFYNNFPIHAHKSPDEIIQLLNKSMNVQNPYFTGKINGYSFDVEIRGDNAIYYNYSPSIKGKVHTLLDGSKIIITVTNYHAPLLCVFITLLCLFGAQITIQDKLYIFLLLLFWTFHFGLYYWQLYRVKRELSAIFNSEKLLFK
jgi:hypothetical protein